MDLSKQTQPLLVWIYPIILLFLCYLASWIDGALGNIRLRSLGGRRAPRVQIYLPFGVDFMFKSIRNALQHRSIETWQSLMLNYTTPDSPHTVEVRFGGARYIITQDSEIIKAVLATQFTDFEKGKTFNAQFREFLGDSVFTTDGKEWHDSRQMIRPIFVNQRLGDLEVFERHVQALMAQIEPRGGVTSIQDLFFRYTLDVSTDFMYGETVGSLENAQTLFAKSVHTVQKMQAVIVRAGPLFPLLPLHAYRRGISVIRKLVQPYVSRTLSILDKSKKEIPSDSDSEPDNDADMHKSTKEYTFLHALAHSSPRLTPKKIQDELVNLLFAGRDTTAATLSWLFYELSRRPDVVAKLRAEIRAEFGSIYSDDSLPTLNRMQKLRYLRHVVDEILRLYPPVPFNIRYAAKDTFVHTSQTKEVENSSIETTSSMDKKAHKPLPLAICKGDRIVYSPLGLHRRPDIYPASTGNTINWTSPRTAAPADVFSPERWETWSPKPWTYIPFNGGPRICVGQRFALNEIYYTLCRIFQRYDRIEKVDMDDGDKENQTSGRGQFIKTEIVSQ